VPWFSTAFGRPRDGNTLREIWPRALAGLDRAVKLPRPRGRREVEVLL
jgi:hypothetical protein